MAGAQLDANTLTPTREDSCLVRFRKNFGHSPFKRFHDLDRAMLSHAAWRIFTSSFLNRGS